MIGLRESPILLLYCYLKRGHRRLVVAVTRKANRECLCAARGQTVRLGAGKTNCYARNAAAYWCHLSSYAAYLSGDGAGRNSKYADRSRWDYYELPAYRQALRNSGVELKDGVA